MTYCRYTNITGFSEELGKQHLQVTVVTGFEFHIIFTPRNIIHLLIVFLYHLRMKRPWCFTNIGGKPGLAHGLPCAGPWSRLGSRRQELVKGGKLGERPQDSGVQRGPSGAVLRVSHP